VAEKVQWRVTATVVTRGVSSRIQVKVCRYVLRIKTRLGMERIENGERIGWREER
jgi:hypothetical protein